MIHNHPAVLIRRCAILTDKPLKSHPRPTERPTVHKIGIASLYEELSKDFTLLINLSVLTTPWHKSTNPFLSLS